MKLSNISLHTRITVAALALVTAGALGLMFIEESRLREAYLSERHIDLDRRVQVHKLRLIQPINTLRQDVLFLSNVPPISGIVRAAQNRGYDARYHNSTRVWEERLQQIFSAFAAAHPDYYQIRYVGVADAGRELVRINSRNGKLEAAPSAELQARGEREWFKATVGLHPGEVHLSEFELDRHQGQLTRPTLHASAPVFTESGKIFGMVVIDMDVAELLESARQGMSHGGQTYIANMNGQYLLHPDPKRAFAFDADGRSAFAADFPEIKAIFDPQTTEHLDYQPQQTNTTKNAHAGSMLLMDAERIHFDPAHPARFLLLAYVVPDSAAARQLTTIPASRIVGGFAAMLLVGLLAMLALRRMFAPLAHLTTVAEKIAAGERDISLQRDGGGEIGTLNNALYTMLSKLSQRELEILHLNEELEERYRALFDNMLDGYAYCRMLFEGDTARDFIYLDTNSVFEKLTGLKHAGGKKASELMPGIRESNPELFEIYGRVALTGKPERFETYIGPLQAWFSVTAYSPKKEHFVAIFDDITKEKRAAEEIASLMYRNKALMQTSTDGIHIMDGEGNILEANDAFCRMLGYTLEEVMHLNVADWDAQWSADELRMQFKKLIGQSVVIETLHRRKDGTLINVEICATGVHTSKGPIHFASSRDITGRKQIEAVLLQHRRVIETSIDGFWMADMEGKLLEVNQAYAEMSGYSVEELLNMHISQLEVEEQAAEIEAHIAKIMAQGHDRFETRHRHKDGHEFDVEISANYLPETQHLAMFCNDITGRKRAEEKIIESYNLLKNIVENTPARVFWKDTESRFLGCNTAFARDAGMSCPEDMLGKDDFQMGWRKHAELYRADDKLVMNSGIPKLGYEEHSTTSDGRTIWLRTSKVPLFNADGRAIGVLGIYEDITERKQIEENLRVAAITFETNDAIVITDADANIIRVNRAFTEITGYGPEEVLGKNPNMMNSGRHDKTFYTEMWQQLLHHGAWSGEIWDQRKNGQIYPKWLNITAVKDEAGETTRYVAIFSDITARKHAEEEIRNLAFYDPLTHLPNRRLFIDRFRAALPIAARRNNYGALLFIDLDKFKMINDTLGHDYGDLLLIEVAKRIKQCVREMDTVARLGGDEFTVLIEGVSKDKDDASRKVGMVAEKIRESLAQPYQLKEQLHHSSPSIGVCLFRGNEEAVDVLLRHADMAMYQAKESGRNAVRFYDPAMQHIVTAHAAMESELRDALARQQLHLYFQMQVDNDNRPLGAEALLRWNHPQRGMVAPDEFIPIAEQGMLIFEIGNWVLDTACQQLARWAEKARTRDLTLAINVSSKQFAMSDYVDNIARAIRRHKVNPARLKLELTEGMVLANLAAAIEKMHALKALGVRLSIDDFGTGYSSLSYLKLLPIDQLKIDQSFVKSMASDPNDAILVHAIIELANNFHLNVIAEGVETGAQRDFLKDNHCMEYQGFLFSKAVPIEEFEALLGDA